MESVYVTRTTNLLEYMKIHLISLIQDLDELHSKDDNFKFVEGQITATKHLMSVANDILSNDIQGKGY
jgi:hypothetical protein